MSPPGTIRTSAFGEKSRLAAPVRYAQSELQKLLNKRSTHRKPGAKQSSNVGVDSIRITPKLRLKP